MKNFKKVISAVIALALSASTLVSAASFTDVADTASYAEAIDVLSSLGIVNGYEDGTFKPEGEITRAEAATMIVGALNMTDDAVAAAGTTQFADVNEKAAWASGYINVGVAQKFISGMGDGTFAPQANVTYAQMCVMLTIIAGYGDYASNGGYPTGYTTMAATTGINKGVSVGDNTALTRGQVAQMIYNTLVTPMLGVDKYTFQGNEYAMLDGTDGKFKTLLSDKFDGYTATITIDSTPVSTSSVETDKFTFKVEKSDWFFDLKKVTTTSAALPGYFVEGVDVNGSLKQTGKAVFVGNDDDEYVLVYFAPTTKTDKKEFDAESYKLNSDLVSSSKDFANTGKIRFDSKYYEIESDAKLYVNGSEVAGFTLGNTDLDTYLGEAMGTITLIDTDAVTDGYDNIFVDIWQVAKVFGVEYANGETKISMSTKSAVGTAYETITITDEALEDGETMVYAEEDGEAIELTSIAKNDIIAFRTVVDGASVNLKNPTSIEILVTDDTINGKVTGQDVEDKTYTIDGTEYSMVVWSSTFVDVAKSYTITLDPFGRMVEKEIDGSSALYAIVLDDTNDMIKLLLPDGTTKSYELAAGAGKGAFAGYDADDIANHTYANVYNRIVTYKVKNSTGEITSIEPVPASGTGVGVIDAAPWTSAEKYVSRTGRLGGMKIAADTVIIDASKAVMAEPDKAGSYSVFNAENLKDGAAYYYAIVSTDTLVNFVLIKQAGTKFNNESRFAVVKKAPTLVYTEEGDEVESVTVLLDGVETELLFNTGVYDDIYNDNTDVSLSVGDAFFYDVDVYGYVDKVFVVYDGTFHNLASAITAVKKNATTYYAYGEFIDTVAEQATADEYWGWNLDNSSDRADIQLVEGYVVEAESDLLTFAATSGSAITTIDTTKNLKNDPTGVVLYSVAEDADLYVYDAAAEVKNDKYTAKNDAAVLGSTKLSKYLEDGKYDVTNVTPAGTDLRADANYAVAMIVDGEVVAIYVVKA